MKDRRKVRVKRKIVEYDSDNEGDNKNCSLKVKQGNSLTKKRKQEIKEIPAPSATAHENEYDLVGGRVLIDEKYLENVGTETPVAEPFKVQDKVPKKTQLSEKEIEMQKSTKMNAVISKILKKNVDSKRPVLALKKGIEKQIDDEKLEDRARKLLARAKKMNLEAGKVVPTHETSSYEKGLRKTATRGVVQLFNAIRVAQKTVEEMVQQEGIKKDTPQVPAVSKQAFLSAIKDMGQEKTSLASKAEQAVPFLAPDFATTLPVGSTKHWDQE